MAMTMVETTRLVTGGVDTHLDVHVAAAVDGGGGVLGVESFATTPAGFVQLHDWMTSFGTVARVGVEGTGAYGAGLARYLRGHGLEVIEVDRPNRQQRRRAGKSDTTTRSKRLVRHCRVVRRGSRRPAMVMLRRSERC
jgi:transposase